MIAAAIRGVSDDSSPKPSLRFASKERSFSPVREGSFDPSAPVPEADLPLDMRTATPGLPPFYLRCRPGFKPDACGCTNESRSTL